MMTSGAMGKLYGATGLVGKDEMNGRINPGLEPDDDLDDDEIEKLKAGIGKLGGGGGGGGGGVGATRIEAFPDRAGDAVRIQGNTAF